MDDGKLRALLTAVDCGSFSKAAAQLGYTQSAMTHLVNKLEAEIGCTLLERDSQGIRLTDAGRQLLPYIQNVVCACDTLLQEAALRLGLSRQLPAGGRRAERPAQAHAAHRLLCEHCARPPAGAAARLPRRAPGDPAGRARAQRGADDRARERAHPARPRGRGAREGL